VIFRVFFVLKKHFLVFTGIVLALKNKFGKNLSYWNGPSPKARPAPARSARPPSPSGPGRMQQIRLTPHSSTVTKFNNSSLLN
jgi:hypothetical protein